MAATLGAGGRGRFSETARSRPGPAHAAGEGLGRRPPAVRGRRLANDRPERPAERAEAGEADVEADLRDRPSGLAQQGHGALHALSLEGAVGRLAERAPELADE